MSSPASSAPGSPPPPSIFTRIIRGEVPCHKVYEDDRVFAFLDINPLAPGHTLVIPKEPAVTVDKLSDESAAAIGRILPRLCRAVMRATGTADYNILQNNGAAAHQEVMHVHFHIIPKPRGGAGGGEGGGGGQGLGIDWPSQRLDHATGADLARAITAAL